MNFTIVLLVFDGQLPLSEGDVLFFPGILPFEKSSHTATEKSASIKTFHTIKSVNLNSNKSMKNAAMENDIAELRKTSSILCWLVIGVYQSTPFVTCTLPHAMRIESVQATNINIVLIICHFLRIRMFIINYYIILIKKHRIL